MVEPRKVYIIIVFTFIFSSINGYFPTVMSEISVGYDQIAFRDDSVDSAYALLTREVFGSFLPEQPNTVCTASMDSLCLIHKLGTVFQKTTTLPDFSKILKNKNYSFPKKFILYMLSQNDPVDLG